MKTNDFKLSFTVVSVLLIISLVLVVVSLAFSEGLFKTILCSFGIGVFFVSWLIVFIDILKHKVYNRQFWIMSMIIMSTIAPIIYLVRRKKLILE